METTPYKTTLARSGLLISTLLLLAGAAHGAPPETPRVLAVLQDFEDRRAGKAQPIKYHAWSAEEERKAAEFSQIEIVPHPVLGKQAFGKQCLKIAIGKSFPWGNRESYRALTVGPDYLPPEADLIRMRVKVLEGAMTLSVGSPTVYFGHSDVSAKPIEISSAANPDWQTLEFSLHRDLSRNNRRARFGAKSPVIEYARWIQEPLYLFVSKPLATAKERAQKPSSGEILVDQIELVARGEGRAYPRFTSEQIRTVSKIADFEDPAERDRAFTFFQEPIDLAKPPYLVRDSWKPAKLQRVAGGKTGQFSLRSEHVGSEETCFTGIRAVGSKESNAIACTLRAEHDGDLAEIVLDFVVYVSLAKGPKRFPWDEFRPPESWRNSPLAFDYYLDQPRTQGASYGFYHVRRSVPNREWTTLVLPCADFLCAYGQRECAGMFERQTPLECETIFALGFLSPFRQHRAATVVSLDELSFVSVPGEPESLRSFWQPRPEK